MLEIAPLQSAGSVEACTSSPVLVVAVLDSVTRTVEAAVRAMPQTDKYLDGKTVVKVIVVPGKIVNIVIK